MYLRAARLVILVLLAAVTGACTSGSTASSSPVSTPSPTWTTFREPNWGYSIEIPTGWSEISQGEAAPRLDRDFSNESVTNAGTLAGLDQRGFFFQIAVSRLTAACPQLPTDGEPNFEILIDTYPATALILDDIPAFGSQVSAIKVDATTDRYCYSFLGVGLSTAIRDSFLSTVIRMLLSFKFGTPTAPPV